MEWFGQRTDNPTRTIREEIAAVTNRINELPAQLAAIEQKRDEALLSAKALDGQRQGLQNELAEAQRRQANAEMRLAAIDAAIEQKLGEALLSVKPLEDQRQSLQNELAEAQRRRAGAETRLAAVEQKLGEVSVKMLEDQRQSLQNELAEAERRRAHAEVRMAVLLQAAEPTRGSNRLENVARVPIQIVTDYRTRLSTYAAAAGWPILTFAFIASFIIFAAVFGIIPWR